MTEERSFQRELARRRHSPERVYGLVIWALAVSGVGGYGLLKDGPSAAGYGAVALSAVLLVTAGLLLVLCRRRLQVAFALLDKGAAAEGTVTAIRKRWFSRDYAVHFEFRDPFGRAVRGTQPMSQEEAFTWREGDKGLVRLDPKQPGNHVWIGRGVLFDEEDEENEVGAIGVITSVAEQSEDDRKGWLVRYSYRDHLGQTHEATFAGLQADGDAPCSVGDRGQVRFDPRRPKAGEWVGKVTDAALGHELESRTSRSAARPRTARPVVTEVTLLRLAWRSRALRKSLLYLVPAGLMLAFAAVGYWLWASGRIEVAGDPSTVWGVLALVPALWSLRRGVHEVKEWRRLLRDGLATDAVVSLVKETYEEVRGRRGIPLRKYGWIVHYRYKDQAGYAHTGESGYLPRHEAMACRVGDTCAIRYDPKEPAKSVWITRA